MRAAGFVKKHVWVPEEQAGRLEEIAAEMREKYRPDRVRTSMKRCTGYAPVGPRSSARACGT